MISSKGRFVIPASLRKKYNLKPGDRVHFVDYGGVLALVPTIANPVNNAAGMLRDGPSLIGALQSERQGERRRGR